MALLRAVEQATEPMALSQVLFPAGLCHPVLLLYSRTQKVRSLVGRTDPGVETSWPVMWTIKKHLGKPVTAGDRDFPPVPTLLTDLKNSPNGSLIFGCSGRAGVYLGALRNGGNKT